MKIIKNIIIVLAIILNLFCLTACIHPTGGIRVNNTDTIVEGTIFDTKNLRVTDGDITTDYNYSVKVQGYTSEVDDATWNKWFGGEEHDVSGKIIACLLLEYGDDVASDPDATITMPSRTDHTSTITNKILDMPKEEDHIYLILNPMLDIVNVTIDYTKDNEHRDIKYRIDLMEINTNTNSAI